MPEATTTARIAKMPAVPRTIAETAMMAMVFDEYLFGRGRGGGGTVEMGFSLAVLNLVALFARQHSTRCSLQDAERGGRKAIGATWKT